MSLAAIHLCVSGAVRGLCKFRSRLTVAVIDGDRLAPLMYDYGVGVAGVTAYEVKRVDADYYPD